MGLKVRVSIASEKIAGFCQKHHIRRMALFGSVLRDDFTPASDIDVLVEFELSDLLGGRKVDMNTPLLLSPYFRDQVLAEAENIYVAA